MFNIIPRIKKSSLEQYAIISDISERSVTWSSGASKFSVPNDIESFTFKDDEVTKTATKSAGSWQIN